MTLSSSIGAIRQRLALARVKADIALNAIDRRHRRRSADRFIGLEANASTESSIEQAMVQSGCTTWDLPAETTASLIQSWQHVLTARADGRGAAVEKSTGKAFFQESLSLQDLQSFPAFVSVALEQRLLLTLTRHLRMVPHLESVEVVVSHPTPRQALSASQLWHRDVNDVRLIKLFVYLEDVDDPQGPFTYVPADLSSKISPRAHYLTDEDIADTAPSQTWVSVKGPAGAAFLIDTGRCYHCGSRCVERRVAYIATYSCGIKYMKYSRRWREILAERAADLTELQRRVCGLDA